jgi:hypothetical protein
MKDVGGSAQSKPAPAYIITNHARERYVERFGEDRKAYAHIRECGSQCERCKDLSFRIMEYIRDHKREIDQTMLTMMREAKETNIHHMNNRFMNLMQEKYGYRRFHFLVSGEVLFVVIDAPDGKVLVTCLDVKNSVLGDFVRRPKFKKKQSA